MALDIQDILKTYWGYSSFRPLQREAVDAVLQERDSLVVLPTGGGKSLCYQAPAVAMDGLALVISPLISLMKNQVDALLDFGIAAGRLDSTVTTQERNAVFKQLNNGTLKLLYVSPERIFSNGFIEYIQQYTLSFIAIDEAHCISMWGHDFRPEYRKLGILKEKFHDIPLHGYTATATRQVREDIVKQLNLSSPEVLVGSFDRPNLSYKVERRDKLIEQIVKVLDYHQNESGIIYCIRRLDTQEIGDALVEKGYKARPYHAGLDDDTRRETQDAFIKEKVDIIVATIAFGMGIDKSNVRYIIHAAMPKSLENYQQESGRAGRDGLDAECYLFYADKDYSTWEFIISQNSKGESENIALTKLRKMSDFCRSVKCRHKAILEYFGEAYEKANCNACDVCGGDLDVVKDPLVTAQKILCCVVRLEEAFGGDYTAQVLTGSSDKRILENQHNALSTYGLLNTFAKRVVRDWIEQLVAQDCLEKEGDYHILKVTEKGWLVIRGEETPVLLKPSAKRKRDKMKREKTEGWEGVDQELFEILRQLRRAIADRKNIAPFIVFGDAVLRELARHKPMDRKAFMEIHGIGKGKCRQYAKEFLREIKKYSGEDL